VPLSEALTDPAYERPNQYVGPEGLSWLFRWSVGMDIDASNVPPIPTYIRELSGVE
jgi:hypothetical protein